MIDHRAKSEVDLIAEAADRLAKRMGVTFVRDPAKVHDFPSESDDDQGYEQEDDFVSHGGGAGVVMT